MNVAIIGGGLTGLTAAYELSKNGHRVTVFEREKQLGGLAGGFKQKQWHWSLEKSYHHFFTNDSVIISLIKELGLSDKLIIKRPITANLLKSNSIAQLDSPIHLLRFPGLSFTDKLRTGGLVVFCKLYPFWQTLEGISAKQFFTAIGGKRAWQIIWEPLMTGKFSHYDSTIAASWLWARINKRTPNLCYLEGGFITLVEALRQAILTHGGKILTSTPVTSINKSTNQKHLSFEICHLPFEKVLITIPTPLAYKLLSLPTTHYTPLPLSIPHLHAQTLILETTAPILDHVYWLSITDRSFPFLAVVAHTNFMDKKQYGGHHVTYIGNYLPEGHPYLSMTKQQLLKKFMPFIQRICPTMDYKLITNNYLFTSPFAQPVHQLHYSKRAPTLKTSMKNVYLANMDSIYPWDRGTNYAVELGQKAAIQMLEL